MKTYRIGALGGDGIGPEVTVEGLKVLRAIAERAGFGVEVTDYPFGAEYHLEHKELIPDSAFSEMKGLDAILMGAIGDPRFEPGFLEFGIVGRLRFDLDLYVNLRPIRLYAESLCPLKGKKPEDIDLLVVRENTEDAYRGRTIKEDDRVIQEMVYTHAGTERIIRYAYERAMTRPRKKLTLVDKANAIRAHDLYRKTFKRVGEEYPDIQKDYAYIDAACMWLIKNPENFDTVVTTNMFGDILTDLGAALQGGLGVAAGGNIHPGKVSVFEPIHGSAPKYKGQKKANPIATILAAGMMLEHLGETESADKVEAAVIRVLPKLPSLGTDSGVPTDRIGDMVVEELAAG
jgi:3-isopropylmalate dehydrogenase